MKKILIITQKVDKNDPILGFFHRWIEEFSKHCKMVTVICLEKGDFSLPDNVKVYSLGKEKYRSKIIYILKFYYYIWKFRKNYNSVFVHMNQEYVLLGGVFWAIFQKRILFWRNHPMGSFLTDIAMFFSKRVFCTSINSYTASCQKTLIAPVGIDIKEDFSIDIKRRENIILSLGRISRVKNIDVILRACSIITKEGYDINFTLAGEPVFRKDDLEYMELIENLVDQLKIKEKVLFTGKVLPTKTIDYYRSAGIFINATTPGSFDKTILEAAYWGAIPIVCQNIWKDLNEDTSSMLYFSFNDSNDLAQKIIKVFLLSQEKKEEIRKKLKLFVENKHSLQALINIILKEI